MHQDASGAGTRVALKVLALKPLITLVKWMKRATGRGGNRDKADWKEKGRKEWKEATKAESLPQKLWPSLHCQHLFNVALKYFICPAYTEDDNVSLPAVPSLIYMEKVCEVHWCVSCVPTPARNSCFTPLLSRNTYSKKNQNCEVMDLKSSKFQLFSFQKCRSVPLTQHVYLGRNVRTHCPST